MPIFIYIPHDGSGDMEIFSDRPRTLEYPENFGDSYDLRIAEIDGGDSRIIEIRRGKYLETRD